MAASRRPPRYSCVALLIPATLLLLLKGTAGDEVAARVDRVGEAEGRFRRQTSSPTSGSSILTVEWEGIQSGLQDDSQIAGFLIEYRQENSATWLQHEGVIPYEGPNYQYRVKIRDLPSGVTYFVRIKVVGQNNDILVKTPEIKAQTETVSIRCDGQISEVRNVRVENFGQYSLAFAWDAAECGDVVEYQVELFGESAYALFELHRQNTAQQQVTMSNLLPGTDYTLRVRGRDRAGQLGPWSPLPTEGTTSGAPPVVSSTISAVYRADEQVRVDWQPFEPTPQHYEVVIVERGRDGEGVRVMRARVPPSQTSFLFDGLQPATDYAVGVIAFVDHQPRQVYKLDARTADRAAVTIDSAPRVVAKGVGHFSVYWETPQQLVSQAPRTFVIEYRMPNETVWRRYGEPVKFEKGKSDYSIDIEGVSEKMFYSIRVYVVDKDGDVIAQTDEFKVGAAAEDSCAGAAGVPTEVVVASATADSITYKWTRPNCGEQFGPVEGYDYLSWDLDSGEQPDRPAFVRGASVTVKQVRKGRRYGFRVRSSSAGGASPWSGVLSATAARTSPDDADADGNIYRLRIVLGRPASFLVWTPLQQHRGRIRRFKLSYKESSDESGAWQRVENRPDYFRCPDDIGSSDDFCYSLQSLQNGIHYTSDIVYQLDTGEWSTRGNPLFFILVKADETGVPGEPNRLTLTASGERGVRCSWLPPLSAVLVDSYKVSWAIVRSSDPRLVPGIVDSARLPGSAYSHHIDTLYPDTVYNVSVVAGSAGQFGPPAWQIFTTHGGGPSQTELAIDRPAVEQRGDTTLIRWRVRGDTSKLCCYQIDMRDEQQNEWQRFGSLVTSNPSVNDYSQTLDGLAGNKRYYMRIRALDRSRAHVTTSEAVAVTTHCSAPTAPPTDVALRSDGSRSVVMEWTPPPPSTWRCSQVSYVIEGTAGSRQIRERVASDPRGFRVERRLSSEPGVEWRLRVQTENSGGRSPFSAQVHAVTEQEGRLRPKRGAVVCADATTVGCDEAAVLGVRATLKSVLGQVLRVRRQAACDDARDCRPALVSTPTVQSRGSELQVNWRAIGRGRGVYAYRVQYKLADGSWTPYGQLVPYRGDNELYSQTLRGMQVGRAYAVRVTVLDRNQYPMYTSDEATVRTSCTAPTEPPAGVRATTPDPGHVRVDWTPPAQPTWHCDSVRYELEVVRPARAAAPFALDARQSTHVFNSRPNEQWAVRMRTVNQGGASRWSPEASVRTQPAGQLIIGPTVTRRGDEQRLRWESAPGVDDLVGSYTVEFDAGRGFQPLPGGNVRYVGSQRPYDVPLNGLPEDRQSRVRVIANDRNNGVAYTSPAVTVAPRCSAPSTFPPGLSVEALDATRIRVRWQPLRRDQWNCGKVWYILKYSTATSQGYSNFTAGESFTVFDTEPNTEWQVQIQAANDAGASSWSPIRSDETQQSAPGPVGDLRAYPAGPSALRVTWRPPVRPNGVIVGYDVTRELLSRGMCDDSGGEQVVRLRPDGRAVSLTLSGLHPHSKYRISVAALTDVAGPAELIEAQTENAAPSGPPRALQAVGSTSNRLSLSWQAPACLDTHGDISEYEYTLEGVDEWARGDKAQGSSVTPRADVGGLTPFSTYRARTRAYTSKGPGPWTDAVEMTTDSADQAGAPTSVRVVDSSDASVDLFWLEPYPSGGQLDRFKVRYTPSGTGQWQEREFSVVDLRDKCNAQVAREFRSQGAAFYCATIDGLRPEIMYDFQVSAHINGKQWGQWSETESARIGGAPVQILGVEKIGGTQTSLEIRWNVRPSDQPRVQKYRIIVSKESDTMPLQQLTVDGATFEYLIDGLQPKTNYNVTVQAKTDADYSIGRSAIMKTQDAELPVLVDAPRIGGSTATSLTVEWRAPPGDEAVNEYVVEYRVAGGAWSRQPVRRVDGQRDYSATVVGLPANSEVDVRVRPADAFDKRGDASPAASTRTACAAPQYPPSGIRVDTPSATEVRVTWARQPKSSWRCDHLTTELSYKQQGEREQLVAVPAGQSEYVLPSAPHTSWTIRMRSKNQIGESGWSEPLRATTGQDAPGLVRNLDLRALSPNEVRATWRDPLDKQGVIVGYDVSYRLKHRLACPDDEPQDASREWITVYNVKDLDYTITGLLPFSEYEVKVRARTTKPGPDQTKSVSTLQTTPSAPPVDLQLAFSLERSLSFEWQLVECSQRHGHIISYEYEIIGQDNWAKLERQVSNTSETTINTDGLTPFTKYVMRVKAFNSAGGGPNTENLEVQTAKAEAPLPPQDLVVMQEGTEYFMVSWLPPYPPYGPLDRYKMRFRQIGLHRSTGGDVEWTRMEAAPDDVLLNCPEQPSARLCYNFTGLDPGQQFRVQVAARIADGEFGPWSSVIVANTLDVLPDAPQSVTLIDKTDSSLKIGWQPPVDPHGHVKQYRITVEPMDVEGDAKVFIVPSPETEFLIDGLEPETAYNVTIQAGTNRGFGPAVWTRYTTDKFPVPVVGKKPVLTPHGYDKMAVEWSGVFDPKDRVDGYIVEFRTGDDSNWQEYDKQITKHDPVKRAYMKNLERLDPDTVYLVRIKVVDKKQQVSEPSPAAQARTGCNAPTSPPINLRLSAASARQVSLTWQAPPSSTWHCSSITYELQYRNGSVAPLSSVDLSAATSEYAFTSTPFTKWTLKLRTKNEAGTSDWSDEVSATTPESVPGPVKNPTATPKSPWKVTVTWEQPDEPNGVITGYLLTYQLKSKGSCAVPPSEPMQKEVRSEKQILDELEAASTYEITITARTAEGEGEPSEPIVVTTEDSKPTGPPLNVKAPSVSQSTAMFKWDEPTCDQRNGEITNYAYEVEALDDWVADNGTREGVVRATQIEQTQLVPFTRYRFRVRALNDKGEGPFSDWLEVKTKPGAPPAPSDLVSEQAFPNAVKVSFLPPRPPHGVIDEYRIRHTTTDRIVWETLRQSPDQLSCGTASAKARLCYRVVGLEPKSEYAIQVAARTADGGFGDWTKSLYVNTLKDVAPVPEVPLRVSEQTDDSVTIIWEGLEADKARRAKGFVLEYRRADSDDEWTQYNDVVPSKGVESGLMYRERVDGLQPDTAYGFQLRVVTQSGERGLPGPELATNTLCGAPKEPPSDVRLSSVDFETVKLTWTAPPRSSWSCGDVAFVLRYRNSTHDGQMEVGADGPSERLFETRPGTRWTVSMRTRAIQDGEPGKQSAWSPETTNVTQGVPGEIFVTLEPEGADKVKVGWELPDGDKDWTYGVDISYALKQKGDCDPAQGPSNTKHEIYDKEFVIDDLEPYSLYEVTVTPRSPTGSSGDREGSKKEVRTGERRPTGPPTNVRAAQTSVDAIGFKWEPPQCDKRMGAISQYEYKLEGVDDWVKEEPPVHGVSSRTSAELSDLQPGTRYRFSVQAYTAVGPGPWSEPIEIQTSGSSMGPPRELHTVNTFTDRLQLSWLPPYPLNEPVADYRLRLFDREDRTNARELVLPAGELTCGANWVAGVIGEGSLCSTVDGLAKATTYGVEAQARAHDGQWGDWSAPIFATTKERTGDKLGGDLKQIGVGANYMKVRWTPPGLISDLIDYYLVSISVAVNRPQDTPQFNLTANHREFYFKDLSPSTPYNVSIEGRGRATWNIEEIFETTDSPNGILSWLPAPTDLHLLKKTDNMMELTWNPPELLDPDDRDRIKGYYVTVAPFDERTGTTGPKKSYSVPKPGNKIKLEDLRSETIYNVTVQATTDSGKGEVLWGAYSTLSTGAVHVLKLIARTPTSLHVSWDRVWGTAHDYVIKAQPLHSVDVKKDLSLLKTWSVEAGSNDFVLTGLTPSTIYNVTLQPKDVADGAWGAYATLPRGSFVVRNLRVCSYTDYAVSMSWDALDSSQPINYKVRYTLSKAYSTSGAVDWVEATPQRSRHHLSCPGMSCGRLCYLLFNLPEPPSEYIIQVSAFAENTWNRWKTVPRLGLAGAADAARCCIVPPDYYLDTIGVAGTSWDVSVRPVPNVTHVQRYFVVVDERDPPGKIDEAQLTDMLSAKRAGLPYYVAGAFNTHTLPRERTFTIGDGTVYGGYLNYPLIPGKKYNWAFVTIWDVGGRQVVGFLREERVAVGGWAWFWQWLLPLLLLLLLLLLILLCCCLYWCLASRYRKRERRRVVVNGRATVPLLTQQEETDKANAMQTNMKALENRIDTIRTQLDTRVVSSNSGKGDFEDGYMRGFRDSNKLGGGTAARQRLDEDYGGARQDFQSGYAQGLRDAGLPGMTTSMHNLAARGSAAGGGGYSSGYTQGFRDGNSGIFGDRMTTTLLKRLQEQYPGQDDFQQGYIEGFKDSTQTKETHKQGSDHTHLESNLSAINERLHTLEKQTGDEIHSTKVYHVYNQLPDGSGYQSAGAQLAHELEESSMSQRSTLRHHYTPGDYLKYASDNEGYPGYPGSLRHRRSLSASALARDDYPSVGRSPTPRMHYASGSRTGGLNQHDSYSRRYNYRSRSDVASAPRRYASQTLLDGVRPGPATPVVGHRRDALESLQRELDTLTRTPTADMGARDLRGYSSDTGYLNDTWRSGRPSAARTSADHYDYDSSHYSRNVRTQRTSETHNGAVSRGLIAPPPPSIRSHVAAPPSTVASTAQDSATSPTADSSTAPTSSSLAQAYNLVGLSAAGDSSGSERGGGRSAPPAPAPRHNWPDELMDIVQEPMGQTLDRMKHYSDTLNQFPPGSPKSETESAQAGGPIKESISESYSASYKEEITREQP